MEIVIITRDINGCRNRHTMTDTAEAYNWCRSMADNEPDTEILLVAIDGSWVYSALLNEPLDWEDLVGFFA